MSECCQFPFSVKFKPFGRSQDIFLNGFFIPSFVTGFTQEEQDRYYRYQDVHYVRVERRYDAALVLIYEGDEDWTYQVEKADYLDCSFAGEFDQRILSASGTYYNPGNNPGTDPGLVSPDPTIITSIRVDWPVITPTDDFSVDIFTGAEILGSFTRNSATSWTSFFSDPPNPARGDIRTREYTADYTDWIDYDYALGEYADVLDQLAVCQADEDIVTDSFSDATADAEQGTEYGVCGEVLPGCGGVLGAYAVNFDDSYADKDHKVDRVNVVELSAFDFILLINEDLGRPDEIRVVGEIAHASQDDPIVETITAFDEVLTLVGAVPAYDAGSDLAWDYGTPTAFSGFFTPPTAGGTNYVKTCKVQVIEGAYFSPSGFTVVS